MEILLVQQFTGPSVRPIVPLGLISLATYVEHASPHRAHVFDPNVHDDWQTGLAQVVRRVRPDLVGVSFRNSDSTLYLDRVNFFPGLKALVGDLRALCPSVPIVVGGAGVATFSAEILDRLPQVDACIVGPGEESLVRLADSAFEAVPGAVYRAPGSAQPVWSRAVRGVPFTDMPIPRREFVPMERYLGHPNAVGVLSKQGCPRQCLYCTYPLTSGRRLDVRNPDHVVDELEYLARDFGVQHVYFADNQFNEPVGTMVELCEAMIRRGSRMRWTAFFNCFRRNLDADLLALVKRAGCTCVQATPEGYPQRYLDVFGKYREEDVRHFIGLFREEREVEALIDFFVEAPGQRLDDFFRMLAFVGWQVLECAWRRVPVTFKLHALRIYPETPIYRRAVEQGYLPEGADLLGEGDVLDEGLYYLTPLRKAMYGLLLVASRLVGYRTPDYRLR